MFCLRRPHLSRVNFTPVVCRFSRESVICGLVYAIALALLTSSLPCQQVFAQATVASNERYSDIPGDSLAIVSLDVEAITKQKALEALPWEVWSALGREQLGFDPVTIQSVDLTLGMILPSGPEFGLSIRTSKPVDIAKLPDQVLSPVEISPKNKSLRFRNTLDTPIPMRVAQVEPNVVLVGTEGTLRRMINGKFKASSLTNLVKNSKRPLRAAIEIERIRPLLISGLDAAEGQMPEDIRRDLEAVIEAVTNIFAESDTNIGANMLHLSLGTADKDAALALEKTITKLRLSAVEILEAQMNAQVEIDEQMSSEVKQSITSYAARLKSIITSQQLWKVSDTRIDIETEVAGGAPAIGVMTGLLLPAIQAARQAARRMQSTNNLRQIMLAALNYESAYKKFPARAITDKEGNPLLSWRVAILPFIEENQLYSEFHLDEPWDSEHNIKLLDRMPATLRHPDANVAPNMTVYLAPYGAGYYWELIPNRISSITDGTSNTISFVEVADQYAVPWTKPDDLDLDEVELLDWFRLGGSNVSFFDCSIRFISSSIDELVLEASLTPSGGEVVTIP